MTNKKQVSARYLAKKEGKHLKTFYNESATKTVSVSREFNVNTKNWNNAKKAIVESYTEIEEAVSYILDKPERFGNEPMIIATSFGSVSYEVVTDGTNVELFAYAVDVNDIEIGFEEMHYGIPSITIDMFEEMAV